MKKRRFYFALLALSAFLAFLAACGEGTPVNILDNTDEWGKIQNSKDDFVSQIKHCSDAPTDKGCPTIDYSSSSAAPPPPPEESSSSAGEDNSSQSNGGGNSSQSTGGNSSQSAGTSSSSAAGGSSSAGQSSSSAGASSSSRASSSSAGQSSSAGASSSSRASSSSAAVSSAAQSSASTYTITFNANGGSVSPGTGTTGTDGKLASLPTPTKSGYTFNNWTTAQSGGTQVTTNTVFTQPATIYAQWTEVATPSSASTGGGSDPPGPQSGVTYDDSYCSKKVAGSQKDYHGANACICGGGRDVYFGGGTTFKCCGNWESGCPGSMTKLGNQEFKFYP